MTPDSIKHRIEFLELDNKLLQDLMQKKDLPKEIGATYRNWLRKNNHELMHLKSTLISLESDPLMSE